MSILTTVRRALRWPDGNEAVKDTATFIENLAKDTDKWMVLHEQQGQVYGGSNLGSRPAYFAMARVIYTSNGFGQVAVTLNGFASLRGATFTPVSGAYIGRLTSASTTLGTLVFTITNPATGGLVTSTAIEFVVLAFGT